MYPPKPFKVDDPDTIWSFIEKYPFAILFTKDGHLTHLPINRFSDGNLYGHCARANAQANLKKGTDVTAVFLGPHAYISPHFYSSDFNVPTWNYSAVHCQAMISYIDDESEVWQLLTEWSLFLREKTGGNFPRSLVFDS